MQTHEYPHADSGKTHNGSGQQPAGRGAATVKGHSLNVAVQLLPLLKPLPLLLPRQPPLPLPQMQPLQPLQGWSSRHRPPQ